LPGIALAATDQRRPIIHNRLIDAQHLLDQPVRGRPKSPQSSDSPRTSRRVAQQSGGARE
ncbi:MAG: hypothetical protein PVH80_08055, partial [Anaerolineae bacterium]